MSRDAADVQSVPEPEPVPGLVGGLARTGLGC